MRPRISVILPVRNAATTIAHAVGSILDQEFRDFELLVVNDGSTDPTREILASFSDPRLKVIHNRGPHGVAEAMQLGVDRAKAEWIARMDADDWSYPRRLQKQLAMAEQTPGCAAVKTKVRLIDSEGAGMKRHVDWVNSLGDPESIAAARFIESPVAHPSSMIRKSILAEIGGYRSVAWAEDHDVWMRLLEAGGKIAAVPDVLLDWRDSSGRLTRSDTRYGDEARMEMRCHYLARLPDIRSRGVVIAGAGPIGKTLAQGLTARGVTLHGFFEVHPRRIGNTIHGVGVRSSDEMGLWWRNAVLLGAVGVRGGREKVRRLAEHHGRGEGHDFWSVC